MPPPDDDRRTADAVREEAVAWLARLRSGASDADHAAFEQWYAGDPRHADTYDALLDSWEETRLSALTPAGQSRRPIPPRHTWPRAAAAAAAVLLLIVAGITFTRFNDKAGPPQVALVSRVGEIRTVTLADGSRVTLDTDSIVRADFDRRERRIRLEKGRARFEVAHEPDRPFVVVAGRSEVVARGTVFDVDLRGPAVIVALLRGSVEVRDGQVGEQQKRPAKLLAPGQQLTVAEDVPAPQPAMLNVDAARWPTGMLSFEDAPLGEVVAAANRYSARPLVVSDPTVAARRFTGTFKASDSAALARMSAAMFDLSLLQRRDGTVVLAERK